MNEALLRDLSLEIIEETREIFWGTSHRQLHDAKHIAMLQRLWGNYPELVEMQYLRDHLGFMTLTSAQSFVTRLRKKLGGRFPYEIKKVQGMGYRLQLREAMSREF